MAQVNIARSAHCFAGYRREPQRGLPGSHTSGSWMSHLVHSALAQHVAFCSLPAPQDALLSPEEAGAQAAAAVKGATTAALSAAAVRREQQAAAAARDQQFPSLAAAAVPQRGVTSGGGGGWGAAARAQPPPVRVPSAASGARAAVDAEPAFSDDEGPAAEDRAATTPGSSGTRAGAPAGPASAALPIGGGGRSGTGGTAELSSSVRSAGGLLGGSPADAAGAAGTAGDYFFYQAAGELVLRHCKRCKRSALLLCCCGVVLTLLCPGCSLSSRATAAQPNPRFLRPCLSSLPLQTGSGCSCAPSTCACCWHTLAPTPHAHPPSLPRRAEGIVKDLVQVLCCSRPEGH